MSRKVPEGWRHLPFSEFAAINPRRPLKEGQRVPFVEMAAIPTQGSKVLYLRERETVSGGSRFTNGDTIFARITPCTENGKTAFVDCLGESVVAAGSTEFIVFGPRRGLSDGGYLYQLARSNLIRGPAIARMTGTTGRQRVPNAVFNEIEIPVPPLPEQRRIAEILSSVDESIAATQAVIEQTRTVKQGVMKRLLTKGIGHTRFKQTEIGEIPEAWGVVKLGEIVDVIDPQPDHRTPPQHEGGVPYIGIGDINASGEIQFATARCVNPDVLTKQISLFDIHDGAFVFGKIGTIGRPTSVPSKRDYCLSANLVLVTSKSRAELKFARQLVQSPTFMQQAIKNTNTTSQPALGIKKMRGILVPLPPTAEMELICDVIQSLDQALSTLELGLARKHAVKQVLMSDLLTGRKRVPLAELAAAQ